MSSRKIWEGPSAYDGKPIMAVVTEGSSNRKTGNVDTLWILPAEVDPNAAVKTGEDAAICGDCPHRREHGELGDCYVLPFQAPLGIWRAVKRRENEN